MLAPDLRVDSAFRRILLILQPTQSSDLALVMIFSSIRLLLPEPQLEQIAKVLDFAFCNCTQSTVAVSPLNALASGYSEPFHPSSTPAGLMNACQNPCLPHQVPQAHTERSLADSSSMLSDSTRGQRDPREGSRASSRGRHSRRSRTRADRRLHT